MPELRQNLVTKEWVIIATERAKRPHEFSIAKSRKMTHEHPPFRADCPFCPGNEHETPEDILRIPESGPWQARIFTNRYPALNTRGARVHCHDGIERKMSGVGYHEVLVESPLHNLTPALQHPRQVAVTLKAFRTRGRQLTEDKRIEHIFYFKNHGVQAGTSIEHTHCQILALPIVPHDARRRITEIRRAVDDEGTCPLCQTVAQEVDQKERLIYHNEHFASFIPYAAFSPFHIWIIPLRHSPTFLDQSDPELEALAEVMRDAFARLYRGLGDPDYNYMIRSAPCRDSSSTYLHWYLSIVPRVTQMAGFELGSGMYINPSLPEESAAFLRGQPPGEPVPSDAAFPSPSIAAPRADGAPTDGHVAGKE